MTREVGDVVDQVHNGTLSQSEFNTKDILTPIQLPCGRTIQNRLVKVAMYEHMSALFGGPPNEAHLRLYTSWAKQGWGMICTGNTQVSRDHLTLGRDLVVPKRLTLETIVPFQELANVIRHGKPNLIREAHGSRPLAILQLSHPGRQSANVIGGRIPFSPPLAPSAIALGRRISEAGKASTILSQIVHMLLFQTPRSMTTEDIDTVVDSFVRGAELAVASGFDGVQLHAAHGYLISQFMFSKTNRRKDEYEASGNALRFLQRVLSNIRRHDRVPDDFVLGIKINAADYVDSEQKHPEPSAGGNSESRTRALAHLRTIASWGMVDFIEVSGGDYENPAFMTQTMSQRQALFAQFAHEAKHVVATEVLEHSSDQSEKPLRPPLVLLTGGLRSVPLMSSVLKHQHADLLGIGRMSILCPDLPRKLEAHSREGDSQACEPVHIDLVPEADFPASIATLQAGRSIPEGLSVFALHLMVSIIINVWAWLPLELPKLVGAGTEMAWYVVMMRRLAAGSGIDYSVGGVDAVLRMWLWLAPNRRQEKQGSIGRLVDSWWAMGLVGIVLGFLGLWF